MTASHRLNQISVSRVPASAPAVGERDLVPIQRMFSGDDDGGDQFKPPPPKRAQPKAGKRKLPKEDLLKKWRQEEAEEDRQRREREHRERQDAALEEIRARQQHAQALTTKNPRTGRSPVEMFEFYGLKRRRAKQEEERRAAIARVRAAPSPSQAATLRSRRLAAAAEAATAQRQQQVDDHLAKLNGRIERMEGGTASGQANHMNYGHSFPAHMKEELIAEWQNMGHRILRGHEKEEGKNYTNFIKDKDGLQHNVHVTWT